MLDFDVMVRNLLWEMQSVGMPTSNTATTSIPAATTSSGEVSKEENSKQDTTNIYTWLTTGSSPYDKLKPLWNSFIKKGYVFCSPEELNNLVYAVVSNKPRNTKNPENFVNLESIYPLLDLIANLYEYCFKGNKNPDSNKAEKIFTEFTDRLDDQIKRSKESLKPFDFNALDGWVQSVKAAALSTSQNELGRLRLDTMKDHSIYQIVYKICEIRKKSLLPTLPKSVRQLSGQGIIDKIMLEPWTVVEGKVPINDEKLRAVYDQLSVNKMVSLSIAAYKLYQQQLSSITGKNTDNSLYEKFIGSNEKAKYFGWLNPAGAGAGTDPEGRGPVTASFDQTIDLLYKEILTEEEQSTDARKPFETSPGSNLYVYSYETIKEASDTFKIVEANNLLKELQGFADFVKTKQNSGRLAALGQVAGSLDLGVKMF